MTVNTLALPGRALAHTRESVLLAAETTPYLEDVDKWRRAWLRPITQFGLMVRKEPPLTPYADWDFTRADVPVPVRVDLIRSSTQGDGVRLDALAHYLTHPAGKLFDRDGWFGNLHPVLILRADGTYTIRDGNHRVIAAILDEDETVLAHVKF